MPKHGYLGLLSGCSRSIPSQNSVPVFCCDVYAVKKVHGLDVNPTACLHVNVVPAFPNPLQHTFLSQNQRLSCVFTYEHMFISTQDILDIKKINESLAAEPDFQPSLPSIALAALAAQSYSVPAMRLQVNCRTHRPVCTHVFLRWPELRNSVYPSFCRVLSPGCPHLSLPGAVNALQDTMAMFRFSLDLYPQACMHADYWGALGRPSRRHSHA